MTHRNKQGTKRTESVVASDDNYALRHGKICRVVKKKRAAAFFETAAVKKNHGGIWARARGWRSEHVEVQTILRLQLRNVGVVVILQTARTKTEQQVLTTKCD